MNMNYKLEPEKELLEKIVESEGNCVYASWCQNCPFLDECAGNAIRNGKLLSKEVRIHKAYDKLFYDEMERELNE